MLHQDFLVLAIQGIHSLFQYTHCNPAKYSEDDKSHSLRLNHRSFDFEGIAILHPCSLIIHEDQIIARRYCLNT